MPGFTSVCLHCLGDQITEYAPHTVVVMKQTDVGRWPPCCDFTLWTSLCGLTPVTPVSSVYKVEASRQFRACRQEPKNVNKQAKSRCIRWLYSTLHSYQILFRFIILPAESPLVSELQRAGGQGSGAPPEMQEGGAGPGLGPCSWILAGHGPLTTRGSPLGL